MQRNRSPAAVGSAGGASKQDRLGGTIASEPNPAGVPDQGPRAIAWVMSLRAARCPHCHHVGALPRSLPGHVRLRCSTCGTSLRVRHVVGDRPCRHRKPSPERVKSAAAARDVLERLGDPQLDDRIDDLFGASARGGAPA